MAAAEFTETVPPSPAGVARYRAQLTALVEALAEAGVPGPVIADDVRAGIARVAARHDRSGR